MPDEKMEELLHILKDNLKLSWYIHAFSESKLHVVLRGKYFTVSLHRDDTWDEMIQYGVEIANVERYYLEDVPLHV